MGVLALLSDHKQLSHPRYDEQLEVVHGTTDALAHQKMMMQHQPEIHQKSLSD